MKLNRKTIREIDFPLAITPLSGLAEVMLISVNALNELKEKDLASESTAAVLWLKAYERA